MNTSVLRRGLRHGALLLGMAACGWAQAITGTWGGELADTTGERTRVSHTFSPRGSLVVAVATSSGPRSIELRQVGQSERWLAAGGGVSQGRVQALHIAPDRFETRLSVSTDSQVAQGLLRQEETQMVLVFQQDGALLHVAVQTQGQSTVTGFGSPSVDRWSTLHRGTLRRAE
jgi:hypothetical protein